MESTLVTARVPTAKKEAGSQILAELGNTTTDLVNSAFDYLIDRRELPQARDEVRARAKDAHAFLRESTLVVDWPKDGEVDGREPSA